MSEPGETYLSVREAARRLGVHENTVRNWVASGILESARLPGARFHRFAEAEVERVRLARTTEPVGIGAERRIVGPELADATRLGQWADSYDAPAIFPRLVRRLLAVTPGVTDLSARAGEGVRLSGWDAQAFAGRATAWLPDGHLALEIGVSRKPREKAQAEYEKRTADPLGIDRSTSTFVFVTPRRWSGAVQWARDRSADGLWRDVRVLDADAIESWFEAFPAVRYWFSEQIGLEPSGVLTAERSWERFRTRTDPPLPASLVLAGREDAQKELRERLGGPPSVVGVKAQWKDDALAFLCVTVGAACADVAPERPMLIVESRAVWERMVADRSPVTLIPALENPSIGMALEAGKHVLIPLGADDVITGSVINLPPPARAAARDALVEAKFEMHEAERLSALARRSMSAMVRRIAVDPSFRKPDWSRRSDGEVLAPLVFLESWTEGPEDMAAVAKLVGRPWNEVERVLRQRAAGEDPPFVKSGPVWRASSHVELFEVLESSITTSDVRRWQELVAETLSTPDPIVDLDEQSRLISGFRADHKPRISSVMREGMARGLALLSSFGNRPLPGKTSCASAVDELLRPLLSAANADNAGLLWRSIAPELPLLAEAAPSVFLEHVLDGSTGDSPVLLGMFTDHGPRPALGESSPHSYLQWALETLCWSPTYLSDATRALAQLALIDPSGRLSNRPDSSLVNVLVPWIRHTSAPVDQRIDAIKLIERAHPQVGWKLALGLWPSHQGFVMPPHPPRYRDWLPESRSVPIAEWVAVLEHIVQYALEEATAAPARWIELIPRIYTVPPAQKDAIIGGLEGAAATLAGDSPVALAIWEALRTEVSRHRSFPDAEWAMPADVVDRLERLAGHLEPTKMVERHAWLFGWHPDIKDVSRLDHPAYEERLETMRRDALVDVIATDGIEGVSRVAADAEVPRFLGHSLAKLSQDDHRATLLAWLSGDGPELEVAAGWAQARINDCGAEWLRDALIETSDLEPRVRLALCAPPELAVWTLLEQQFGDVVPVYWSRVRPMFLAPEDLTAGVDALLAHGRPMTAITTLAAAVSVHNERRANPDVEIVVRALELLVSEPEADASSGMDGHDVGELFDYLERQHAPLETVARLEFALLAVFQYERPPRALHQALGDSPDLFVDLICRIYRPEDATRTTADPADARFAAQAWRVLRGWRRPPGTREDGSIDPAQLELWVTAARLRLRDLGRADVGDEQIGELLSGSGFGTDNAWPAEPVRDLIERLGSRDLESGIHIGWRNDHSMTTRDIFEGGTQERQKAAQFREWADKVGRDWPRTARLLREIAESYERDGLREDERAAADAASG